MRRNAQATAPATAAATPYCSAARPTGSLVSESREAEREGEDDQVRADGIARGEGRMTLSRGEHGRHRLLGLRAGEQQTQGQHAHAQPGLPLR